MGRQSPMTRAKRRKFAADKEILQARKAALQNMPGPLKAIFDDLEVRFTGLQAENIKFYYDIGTVLAKVKAEPGMYVGKDGTAGIEILENALSLQRRTMRTCVSFVEAYTPDQLQNDLLLLHNPETNFTLHWGHVKYLLTLTSHEKRRQFAEEAVSRNWDPATLHTRIKKAENRKPGHGRSHGVPATPEKQMEQIRRVSKTWYDKYHQVWNGTDVNFFNNALNAGDSQLTPELLDHVTEIRELFLAIADNAASAVVIVERIMARATEQVNAHTQQTAKRRDVHSSARRALNVS